MKNLPLIDLSRFLDGTSVQRSSIVEEVRSACSETGFLYLSGHNIGEGVIDAMRQSVVEIFAQPEQVKVEYQITPGNYRGYIPLGFFTPASASRVPDQYEGFKLHLDVPTDDPICQKSPLYGPNIWPPHLTGAKSVVGEYWKAVDQIADQLLRLFALALGKPESFFLSYFEQPLTGMTLLHYPPMNQNEEGFGIHPHKDSSAFTILYPDSVGGLQVRTRTGTWIDAMAPEGAFIINIGDVMEHWTGGVFKSTPHRVINKTGKERYSFPYFATPRFNTRVEPVVERIDGYTRPPLLMENWQQEIIASNWPDNGLINPDFNPKVS